MIFFGIPVNNIKIFFKKAREIFATTEPQKNETTDNTEDTERK